MRKGFRLFLVAAVVGTVLYGEDFTIPLRDDTSLAVRVTPTQTFVEYNRPSVWRIAYDVSRFGKISELTNPLDVELQFDIGGLCGRKPDQWSAVHLLRHVKESAKHGEFDIEESVGCKIEIVKVTLISVVGGTRVTVHNDLPPVDLTDQLKAIQTRRERLAAERKKKDAEASASIAKSRADEEAKAAAEKAKIRAACTAIYKSTSDKKVGDLLVKEEQQVRACQALGLYPPR